MKAFFNLLVLWLLTFSACKSAKDTTLMAGAAETVITRVKIMPEVNDDLYARALVLAENRNYLAIVSVDIGTLNETNTPPFEYPKVLLEAINEATGIPVENILINASHTHNAPGVGGREMSPESKKWLAGSLAELVKLATDNLQP